MAMLYRYFDNKAYADIWVNGGEIPIRQSAYYRTLEQTGGRADPDESMNRSVTGMRMNDLISEHGPSPIRISPGTNVSMTFADCVVQQPTGTLRIKDASFMQYRSSGLLLSFSYDLSRYTAQQIDKDCKFCVQIDDQARLQEIISQQIGSNAVTGKVHYTQGDDRSDFLKAFHFWPQREVRMIWSGRTESELWVTLPPGVGQHVKIP